MIPSSPPPDQPDLALGATQIAAGKEGAFAPDRYERMAYRRCGRSGLLTDRYLGRDIPADSRSALAWGTERTQQRLTPERLATLRAMNEHAQRRGQSLAQLALAWTLRLPGVTSALIGVSRVEQLDENVRALDNLEFDADELAEIDELTGGGRSPAARTTSAGSPTGASTSSASRWTTCPDRFGHPAQSSGK